MNDKQNKVVSTILLNLRGFSSIEVEEILKELRIIKLGEIDKNLMKPTQTWICSSCKQEVEV